MKLMVSGAGGFIGAELMRAAVEAGDEAVGIVRGGSQPPAIEGAEWVEADLASPGFANALPECTDAVVHLAQSRGYRDFPAGAPDVVAVNVSATGALLDHARRAGASRFVLASTATVYRPAGEPLAETSPLEPDSMYAASKRSAELLLGPYEEVLPSTALRLFTTYGAGQRSMLVGTMAERVLAGEPISIEGGDGIVLSPIHVSDTAAAILAAARASGRQPPIVNVGGIEALSLRQIVELTAEGAGREVSLTTSGEGDGKGYVADRTLFEQTHPAVASPLPFAQGIALTLDPGSVQAG